MLWKKQCICILGQSSQNAGAPFVSTAGMQGAKQGNPSQSRSRRQPKSPSNKGGAFYDPHLLTRFCFSLLPDGQPTNDMRIYYLRPPPQRQPCRFSLPSFRIVARISCFMRRSSSTALLSLLTTISFPITLFIQGCLT